MLPKFIKLCNVYHNQDNWAGIVEDVTPSKIERVRTDWQGASMRSPVKIDVGYKIGAFQFTIKEFTTSIITDLGEQAIDGVQMRFMAATQADRGDCEVGDIDIVMRGRPSDVDFGTIKAGDLPGLKVNFDVAYIKYTRNGEFIFELDPLGGIERFGTNDIGAKFRKSLGI